MKWSEFEALQRTNPTFTYAEEQEIFGSTDDTTAHWHKCCELAIEEASANGTLGKLSWADWIALCLRQSPNAGGTT